MMAFGEEGRTSDAEVAWRDLDAGRMLVGFGVAVDPAFVDDRRLDGELALALTDATPDGVSGDGELRTRGRNGVGTIALEGRDGVWRLTMDQQVTPELTVTAALDTSLAADGLDASAVGGTVTMACSDLARCATFGTTATEPPSLNGEAAATFEITGTLGAPRATGELLAQRFDVAGGSPVDLRVSLAVDTEGLGVSALEARTDAGTLTGDIRVAWSGGALDGRLTAALEDLSRLETPLSSSWAPGGRLDATAVIGGTLDEPTATVSLDGRALELAGQRISRIGGTLELTDTRLETEGIEIERGETRLRVAGHYEWEQGTFAVGLSGDPFELRPLFSGTDEEMPLRGRLSVTLDAEGSLDEPVGSLALDAADVSWDDYPIGTVGVTAELDGRTLRARVEIPELAAVGEVSLALDDARPFEAGLTVTNVDLTRVAAGRTTVTGTGSLRVNATGTLDAPADSMVEARVDALEGVLGDIPFDLTRTGAVRYRGGAFEIEPMEALIGDARVRFAGGLSLDGGDTLETELGGAADDIATVLRLLPGADAWMDRMTVGGEIGLSATVSGTPAAPEIGGALALDDGLLGLDDHPALSAIDLGAVYETGAVRLERFDAVWQGANVTASGIMPPGFLDAAPVVESPSDPPASARLQVEVSGLTPAALQPYVSAASLAEIQGSASATLVVDAAAARLDALRAELSLGEASFTIAGVPVAQRDTTRLTLDDGVVRFGRFQWGSGTDYLTIGGTVALGDNATVDLTVTGDGDLRALRALVPGVATTGEALLIANVTGPLATPELNGALELTGAGIRMAEPRLVVSDLNGALLLTRDGITTHELRGQINGGALEITGALTLDGLVPGGELRLTGRQIAMEAPEGLRTEIDADLVLSLADGRMTLGGTTTVQRGAYREPMTLAGGLLSAVEQQSIQTIGLEEPRALDAMRLDLRLVTANDIRFDNNFLDLDLGADVRLTGTIGEPGVMGRVSFREGGRIRFGIRAYEIETGSIDLVNPSGIEPRVDLRARTRASTYDITLSVNGGAGDLTTGLSSNPSLPESDIVSLLLTGQRLSDAAGGTGARDQALGLVSNELLGSAGRELGIDVRVGEEAGGGSRIRFDSSLVAGDFDPTTRLTVARRISDQIELILSQDLSSSELAYIINYMPRDNIEVRGLFSGANERAYDFRNALQFGAPTTAASFDTPAARVDRGNERVTAVHFAGSTAYPAETLLDVVRVRPGDRFEFHRWQEDQDRLERFFVERGHREVQVRSRRFEEPGSAGPTLEYEIVRGPYTRLVIEGHELPGSVRADMDLAWRRAVFDAFLVEELRFQANRHLNGEGYLRAAIDVTVETRSEVSEKTITVRMEPGPRTERRELVLSGNAALTSETLDALIVETGLDVAVWADPEPLIRTLRQRYRDAGHLEATIAIDPPLFDGVEARLPIRIDEGPPFTIASVRIDGVGIRSETEARRVLDLTPGDPYRESDIRAARSRLERDYRRAGFNSVRVTARSTVELAAAAVDVDVSVEEGLREIIEDIVVEGIDRTHPPLVTRALQIDLGEAVDLTSWSLARTRLYDTGVFRTVDLLVSLMADATADTQPVRARVLLEEWPVYDLRYGLAVTDDVAPAGADHSRDFGVALAGDFSRRNLLGRAATAGASVRYARRQRALRGYLSTPRFFGVPMTTNVYAESRRETVGEERAESIADLQTLTFEQRVRPRGLGFSYSTSLDHNHTFEKEPTNPDFPFDVTAYIMHFNGSGLVDRRDNLFDATRGWFHSSTAEYGFELGEGAIEFASYFAQQYQYWSLGPLVLASAGRLGLARGLGGSDLIPTERFFAGGGNTVRGYPQDSLGPRDPFFGGAAGGNALLVLNQEARFPIVWRFRGVGFLDVGNVFETPGDISFAGMAVGIGLGLRVESPVGLLRFDYGFALTRDQLHPIPAPGEPDTRPRGRFFFSIGQAF